MLLSDLQTQVSWLRQVEPFFVEQYTDLELETLYKDVAVKQITLDLESALNMNLQETDISLIVERFQSRLEHALTLQVLINVINQQAGVEGLNRLKMEDYSTQYASLRKTFATFKSVFTPNARLQTIRITR